jgi:catalase
MGGPRETPDRGFRSFAAAEQGIKERARSETFADHYSQARQFYISQTDTEQAHIASAFTFELSKVQTVAIRSRMVAHLLNVDEDLANMVAGGLRLHEMPAALPAARPTRADLAASPALSILLNGPKSFKGRKVGALVTDGVDSALLEALRTALDAEGAQLKIVAPMVGGVEAADGTWIEADEKIDGAPSVVFDAVALLVSEAGAEVLVKVSTARDYIADAFAHLKFIAYVDAALPLMEKAGIDVQDIDNGCVALSTGKNAKTFVEACRKLRFWERFAAVKQV